MGKMQVMDKGMSRNPVKCSVCGEQTYTYDKYKYYLCAGCGPKYQAPVEAYYKSQNEDGYADMPLKDFLAGMGYDDEK